jgi:hypothetical protein
MRTPWRRSLTPAQIRSTIAARLSPEGTKKRTLFERLTVARLSWDWLVRLNGFLAFVGKIATAIWVAFCALVILGVDFRDVVEKAVNSGKPVAGAIVLVFVLPTAAFLLLRSVIGFLRWRMQRELWRREVEGERITPSG